MSRNLLQETRVALEKNNKTPEDVLWVGKGSGEYAMPWRDFEKIADVVYDNGYGANEVNSGLVVVGDNWWMERGEYDGSEWWEFKSLPVLGESPKSFTTVFENNFQEEWD